MSSFNQRLSVSQKQSLGQTLSPQMQRTMHLMQLSRDELEREVAELCEANPLIADTPAWSRPSRRSNDLADWSAAKAAPVSLTDHLLQQLALTVAPGAEKTMAVQIIEHIAPSGRLPLEDWTALAAQPHAKAALALVQGLEPAGIAARSLAHPLCHRCSGAQRHALALVLALGTPFGHRLGIFGEHLSCWRGWRGTGDRTQPRRDRPGP